MNRRLNTIGSRQRRIWLWLLLAGAAAMAPVVAHGTPPQPVAANARLSAEARQIALIEARILAHAGDVPRACAIYERLRRADPTDREIQEAFVAFLLDHGYHESAQHELTDMLLAAPGNPRALRLQARLYHDQGQLGHAIAIYEQLVATTPDDPQLWADAGAAWLGNAQWSTAIDAYCRALERSPDDREVRQAVHGIIRQHGPRVDAGQQRYEQIADDTMIDTTTLSLSQPLSEATRIMVDYRYIAVSRPRQPFVDGVDDDIDDLLVSLRRQINPRWSGHLGLGVASGGSTNTGVTLGGSYMPADGVNLTAAYQTDRPWYDPADAIDLGGRYDRLQVSLAWDRGRRTAISLQTEDWRYRLDHANEYGDQQTLSGTLTLRLNPDPELAVGYAYYRAWFDYADDRYRPVAMVEDQGWHTLFGTFTHRPGGRWSWGVSAGLRRDHVRRIDGWFLHPTIGLRLGGRLELNGGYQFASESATAVGGKTRTWQIAARLYF